LAAQFWSNEQFAARRPKRGSPNIPRQKSESCIQTTCHFFPTFRVRDRKAHIEISRPRIRAGPASHRLVDGITSPCYRKEVQRNWVRGTKRAVKLLERQVQLDTLQFRPGHR